MNKIQEKIEKILILVFITFILFVTIRYVMSLTSYGDIHTFCFSILQAPFMKLGTSLPATIVVCILVQLCWFAGLHGQNIVHSVISPF